MICGLGCADEKKYRCIHCKSHSTQKRGIRSQTIRYFCNRCQKWSSINRRREPDKQLLLAQHLDGASFRSLAAQYNISHTTAYRWCLGELEKLPHCADITRQYQHRYCGILLVDGKFLKVKGYPKKIPVIYGIDYLTHDIPTFKLAPTESYLTSKRLFESLRLLNYPLRALISDDNTAIYQACADVYPKCVWQLCTNHYKENIRRSLNTRTDERYLPFMKDIEFLFSKKRSRDDFNRIAKNIYQSYKLDQVCVAVLLDIQRRQDELMAHLTVQGVPQTNNLIECYNSHLHGRLKTIKGFENYQHAQLWLNGYFLRRRIKKLTDCSGKFRYLNGQCSLGVSTGLNFSTFADL